MFFESPRESLRPVAMSIVMYVALTCGLAGRVVAQEGQLEIIEFTVGCREEPARGSSVSLNVLSAWIEENTLFADVAVANYSSSEIYLPRRNAGGHYWDAVLYDRKNEPITYCGGVAELNLDPFSELVTEPDIISINPGETVTLQRLALAPFWPYLRDSHHDARSFEVFYIGWSSPVVHLDRAASTKLVPALESASKRQCKLYGGALQSSRRSLPRGAG